MRPLRFALIAALGFTQVAAQAATPDRAAEIKRAVLDICPKVFVGKLLLDDTVQVAAIGYKGTLPRDTSGGKIPRAEIGEGATKIVIAGQGGVKPSCGIWFGGPDNSDRLGELLSAVSAEGLHVGPPARLGDNTMILKASRKSGVPKSLAIILADAGGDFGGNPASTIIFLD